MSIKGKIRKIQEESFFDRVNREALQILAKKAKKEEESITQEQAGQSGEEDLEQVE